MSSTPGSGTNGSMPVIVIPTSVDFFLGDPSTHKRILTLYNPSEDLPVSYKVSCTNPTFYAVVEPEGRISPQTCQDIVIRHAAVASPKALNRTDKFRVTLSRTTDANALFGKRDILATLHPGVPDTEVGSSSLPHGQQVTSSQPLDTSTSINRFNRDPLSVQHSPPPLQHHQPNYVACFAAVICIAALFLPTEGEANADHLKDYPWLILTLNQKLVFAYVLGLVTMAILRMG